MEEDQQEKDLLLTTKPIKEEQAEYTGNESPKGLTQSLEVKQENMEEYQENSYHHELIIVKGCNEMDLEKPLPDSNESQQNVPPQPSQKNVFYCDKCPYTTKNKFYLKTHKSKHSTTHEHASSRCNQSFTTNSSLRGHIKVKHSSQERFDCPHCRNSYSHSRTLNYHIEMKHSNAEMLNCTHCSYSTVSKLLLKGHTIAKHCAEKRYECSDCDFFTPHFQSLQRHINIKHTPGNQISCDECDYTTTQKAYMKRHYFRNHL